MRRIKRKDLTLVSKMANSFSRRTGIDYDELYSEASLAFCEAMEKFDPALGNHINYVSRTIKNRLISFSKKYNAFPYSLPSGILEVDEYQGEWMAQMTIPLVRDDVNVEQFEFHNSLPESLQKIASIIQENPHEYLDLAPRYARGRLYKKLRTMHWKWKDIWECFNKFKVLLNENSPQP